MPQILPYLYLFHLKKPDVTCSCKLASSNNVTKHTPSRNIYTSAKHFTQNMFTPLTSARMFGERYEMFIRHRKVSNVACALHNVARCSEVGHSRFIQAFEIHAGLYTTPRIAVASFRLAWFTSKDSRSCTVGPTTATQLGACIMHLCVVHVPWRLLAHATRRKSRRLKYCD